MGADPRQTGAAVEAAALDYLREAGLQLIARNVRFRGGELDLVMDDAGCTVFVEVRYRRSAAFGGAASSIDAAKQRRLLHAAHCFLQQHPERSTRPCRFDVMLASGQPATLAWLRNAFTADDA